MAHTFRFPEATTAYLLTALTHLHAGSGDTGYGVVDKTVQRDPLEGLPVIHASSLKGAFREAFEQELGRPLVPINGKAVASDHPLVAHIFGSGIASTREQERASENRFSGSHRFHEARLLSLPVRSNVRPFFRATSPEIARQFLALAKQLGIELSEDTGKALTWVRDLADSLKAGRPRIFTGDTDVYLEDYQAESVGNTAHAKPLADIFGENFAVFPHDDFKLLVEGLPVIARNYLENGISKNLWYEEVVPRETRFVFFLQTAPYEPEKPVEKDDPDSFAGVLEKLEHRIQIGANASVGYGLCTCISFPGLKSS